jgi:hypothetical protein
MKFMFHAKTAKFLRKARKVELMIAFAPLRLCLPMPKLRAGRR